MWVDADRFDIQTVMGSGSMGTVFRAVDRENGEAVALKVLRHVGGTPRFDREAEVLERLSHPRIVRYIGHGKTRHGERFLAMEWLEGENLRQRLSRLGLDLFETVQLGFELCAGLAAAHAAHVVHRDVKPSNMILVDRQVAKVKLVDFGVARMTTGQPNLTRTGDVVGTPAYMSPEQAVGSRRVGPPADIFGLGCILYECLAGRPPFVTARERSALQTPAVLSTPPRLAVLRPELPPALCAVIERMMARDAAARPADGAAARAELAALGPLPDVAPPAAPARAEAHHSTAPGFGSLRAEGSEAKLSSASAELVAVLARFVPMPLAVLRSQCERLALDPSSLGREEIDKVAPALAEAVARFTEPKNRAAVLAELEELARRPTDT